MTLQVKVLVNKSDGPSVIPGPHMVEGKISDLHVLAMVPPHTHTKTNKSNF